MAETKTRKEETLQYEHWLMNVRPCVGVRARRLLRSHFGSAADVYRASFRQLCAVEGVSEAQAHAVCESKKAWDLDAYFALAETGVRLVTEQMREYPKRLSEQKGMPDVFYSAGRMPEEGPSAAIIGSRECTAYGEEMARWISAELAVRGVQIISGMARGIDGAAHAGALAAGGRTIGILGCGIDICYPREHIQLYMNMRERGGLLSEYPPTTPARGRHFPARNRLISALADVVIVVETRLRGGSFITVDFALEQGKEVYAVPGRIGDVCSSGCNRLISQGAWLLESPETVVERLFPGGKESVNLLCETQISLATDEKLVYSCLDLCPAELEDILLRTELTAAKALPALLALELKGLVKETAKQYCRVAAAVCELK